MRSNGSAFDVGYGARPAASVKLHRTALFLIVQFGALFIASAEAHSGMKIVAFGTSYTARGTWPDAVARRLAACMESSVEISVVAKAGATTLWGIENIDRVIEEKPDVVLIEFYGNDSAIDEWISVTTSGRNLTTILETLRSRLPTVRVIYMAMNPMRGLRAWIRPRAERYIQTHREIVGQFRGEFIDFRPAWLKLSDRELYSAIPDGLHPVPAAAAEIVSGQLPSLIAGTACR